MIVVVVGVVEPLSPSPSHFHIPQFSFSLAITIIIHQVVAPEDRPLWFKGTIEMMFGRQGHNEEEGGQGEGQEQAQQAAAGEKEEGKTGVGVADHHHARAKPLARSFFLKVCAEKGGEGRGRDAGGGVGVGVLSSWAPDGRTRFFVLLLLLLTHTTAFLFFL